MSDTTNLPERRPRPTSRWRRYVIWSLLVIVTVLAPTFGLWLYNRLTLKRELQDTIAKLDRTDPGWRLEDIEARRRQIPSDKNSALIVVGAQRLLPPDWWSKIDLDKLPPPIRLGGNQEHSLRAELQPIEAAVAEARKLADYPEGRFHFVYTADFVSTLVPELEHVRRIGALLEHDVHLQLQKKQAREAWKSAQALLNTARANGDEPLFISQLLRMTLQGSTVRCLERILAQGQVSESALSVTQRALADEADQALLRLGLLGERGGMHQLFSNLESGQLSLFQVLSLGRKNPVTPSASERVSEVFAGNMILESHAWLLMRLTEIIEITKLPGGEQYSALEEFEKSLQGEFANKQVPVLGKLFLPAGGYKVRLVKGLYQRGWTAEDVRQLFRVIDWLLDLPSELQQGFHDDIHQWEEEQRMPYITSFERHGLAKGRAEGRAEGREDGLREAIATILATKFGAAGKRLMPRIREIREVGEPRALLKFSIAAETLQEIRGRLPPRGT